MRKIAALGLSLALHASVSSAQGTNAGASPEPDGKHSGAPLGQFTLGPVIVTPTFRIGTLAVDTNVQYQRERRADFVASGGPGLDIALPFLDHWKLDLQGSSEYFYFHRTEELRRWTGGGIASLQWKTTGTRVGLSAGLRTDFSRSGIEVDARVAARQTTIQGELERDLGRLTLGLRATFAANKVDSGQEFRGADLAKALTADRYSIVPELRYHLTPLSSILFEGSYDLSRFPNAGLRNFHQESVGLGIQTTGFFKGQVTTGLRRDQLSGGGSAKSQPYLRGNLTQQLGRRIQLGENYTHESTISAFAADGSLPTLERRSLGLNLRIEMTKRIDLQLRGTQEKIRSNGLVNVILDDGTKATAKRDDVAYISSADLGIRLGRARVGLFTSYTTRESLFFSDFGIEGLQAGARVEYSPR